MDSRLTSQTCTGGASVFWAPVVGLPALASFLSQAVKSRQARMRPKAAVGVTRRTVDELWGGMGRDLWGAEGCARGAALLWDLTLLSRTSV